MARYEHSDVCFDVPRDWNDRSIVAFAAPTKQGEGTTANVVMSKDTLAAGETIRAYADKQLVELAKRLDGFRLEHRRELTVGGLPAVEIRFLWSGGHGPLDQRLLVVAIKRGIVLSFTATAAQVESAEMQALFDRIFSTITFPESALPKPRERS